MTSETLKALEEEADFVYGHKEDIFKLIYHPQAEEITSVSFSCNYVEITYICPMCNDESDGDLYVGTIPMDEYLKYKESLFGRS